MDIRGLVVYVHGNPDSLGEARYMTRYSSGWQPSVTGVVLALMVAVSSAQQSQKPPTFRSSENLVTIEVAVVDRDGKPVPNLTPDDFTVTLDGQRRSVRALSYRDLNAVRSEGGDGAAERSSLSQSTTAGRAIVLLIDDLSARPWEMVGLRISADRMLGSLNANDRVGLTTTSGLGPTVSPTLDRAAVRAALSSKAIVGRYDDDPTPFFITIPEALEIQRTVASILARPHKYGDPYSPNLYERVVTRECGMDPHNTGAENAVCPSQVIAASSELTRRLAKRAADQLEAYTHVIRALAGAPAPRVVIALSLGVAAGAMQGNLAELNPVSQAAARHGVLFYAMSDAPDANVKDASPAHAAASRSERAYLAESVKTIASAAGGEGFTVIGTADRFFRRIGDETSATYSLGVEMADTAPQGEFIRVNVSVRDRNWTVRTNTRAVPPGGLAAPTTPEDKLKRRLEDGGEASEVPMSFATSLRQSGAGSPQVGVSVHLPASVNAPLTMQFALIDSMGVVVRSGKQGIAQAKPGADYWPNFTLPVAEGHYRLRVAVADRDGLIGAGDRPVDVGFAHVGPFTTSDLLATWSAADGAKHFFALSDLPPIATTLSVAIELYSGESPATDVRVRFAIVPAMGGDPVAETDVTPLVTSQGVSASRSLSISSLPAGAYVIRATIVRAGTTIGVVSKPITKSK